MSDSIDTFSARLKRAVEERGISQTELAAKAEIERTELNRIVNGKRAPRPREAARLIEVLGLDHAAFLADLDLANDPAFKDEVEHYGKLMRRVLDAEREAAEAQASRNALDESHHEEEIGWKKERAQLHELLSDQRRECAERIKRRDEDFVRREQELLLELSAVRDQLVLAQRQFRGANELANERLRQLAALQGALQHERGRVAAAGVFGGIVGAMLGGGIGAAVAGNQDDEDDE